MIGSQPVGIWWWVPRTPRRGSFTQATSLPISPRSSASFHDNRPPLPRLARAHAGGLLSSRALADEAHADVSLLADVLGVRGRRDQEARNRRRWRADDVARAALQSAVS